MPRFTKQKQLLIGKVKDFSSFFTAEELYAKLDKKVGIATIYRFLGSLEKKADIHSYQCKNRKVYSLNKLNHVHFICEMCGHTEHLKLKRVDFIKEAVKSRVCHFQLDITGICENCINKNK